MDSEKSALLINVTISLDWKFSAAIGSILLARLLLKS
jgi:hypothetical protein